MGSDVVEASGVSIPSPSLVVVVGPAASGKTTWAERWFDAAQVVSSDRLRALVGEGEHDLAASRDAFEVLSDIVRRRLRRRITTVIDSLALDPDQRADWRALAVEAQVPAIAAVMPVDAATCRRRNRARPVPVPAEVLRRQLDRWPQVVADVRAEPWSSVIDAAPVAVVPSDMVAAPSSTVAQRRAAPDVVSHDPAPSGAVSPERPLQIGVHLSAFEWPGGRHRLGEHLTRLGAAADEAGVAHLWVMDHLRQIPQVGAAWHDLPDPATTLAWLASATSRVRLGALVSPAFLRPLGVLAKQIATLDVVSGGRAVCGLGVGWFAQEYEELGIEMPPLDRRYAVLRDALDALPAIWGKGSPAVAGSTVSMPSALGYPRPLQERVPIWVGGSGPRRTLRLVAEAADGCNLFGSPEQVAERVAVLRQHCESVGRDPGEITVSHLSTALIGRDRAEVARLVEELKPTRRGSERFAREVNAGTVDDHLVRCEAYRRAGVDTMIVRLVDVDRPGSLERLATLVGRLGA